MMVRHEFTVKVAGAYRAGLKPVWRVFHRYGEAFDMLAWAPPIRDLSNGYYGFAWDTALGGDVSGDIVFEDGTQPDHPIEVAATREAGIVLSLPEKANATDTTTAKV